MTKTEMQVQAGISTNILAKMSKGEPVAMETLAKICTALECGLDDIVEIERGGSRRQLKKNHLIPVFLIIFLKISVTIELS